MSVESSRLAAAQRTAAAKRDGAPTGRRRWIRLASWVLIVPMLALFSFSIVAGAATKPAPDYAAALKTLPKDKPLVLLKTGNKRVLCAIGRGQAAALSARWRTGWTTMSVDGADVPALWVDGPNAHELREVVGSAADCAVVHSKRVFYLPFDANLS